MKRYHAAILFFAIPILLFSAGCAPLIIGTAAGVFGGVAISNDTAKSNVDKTKDEIWNNSIAVMQEMGTITTKDTYKNRINGIVDESKVTITVEEITPKTANLKVKARKSLLPDPGTAQKISVRIIEYGD